MAWTIRLGGLPAAGFGDRDVLPVLRSDAADRLVGRGQKVTWPLALPVTGRRERAGRTAHARPVGGCRLAGPGDSGNLERRSRLPDSVDRCYACRC